MYPVVILLGDDGQLPCVGAGAFSSVVLEGEKAGFRNEVQDRGFQLFRKFAQEVLTLSIIKRQQAEQTRLKKILDGLYNDTLQLDDAEYLASFHL